MIILTTILQTQKKIFVLAFLSLLMLFGCQHSSSTRFEVIPTDQSGVDFINTLTPSKNLNIFNYLYFYDGGGVAAGDLNGDNLPDLFFTANQGKNRLYLNTSKLTFKEVTNQSFNTGIDDWSTGVNFVDINDDGKLDIYVSNVGDYLSIKGVNKLFINQGNNKKGIPIFKEKAKEYGLDLVGFSTQSAFFDYDRDGDLDMYMMNHSVHSNNTFDYATIREKSHPLGGDKLMRNDNGFYVDVTEEAGIYNSALGYGLGLGISDFNKDGFPDIYIGNDFHEDDYLYLNNGDGSFTESLGQMIQHTSRSSMGNDLIDVNNDALVDILSVDMLPRDYEMLKTSAAEDPYKIYHTKLKYGYKHQVSRNTLQLNRGNNRFSEVGLLSDIYATGWSWASLGADFNHNGNVDLFISNGIKGRTNDLDYISFISQDNIQERLEGEMTEKDLQLTEKMPHEQISNFMYMNKGNLNFEDVSREWGLSKPTYSSGAAYADLDSDGDLEIIVNNVDQPATILKNNTIETTSHSNYLKFKLVGPEGNRFGIGTKIKLPLKNGETIFREFYPVRGYQSSVEYGLHIGLGSLSQVSKIQVEWPDGKIEILHDVKANQTVTLRYERAKKKKRKPVKQAKTRKFFQDVTDYSGLNFVHKENDFVEFNREALIPHMISKEGPALAIGDVNGDGREDVFVGGAKRQASELFIQDKEGKFWKKQNASFKNDFIYEDVDAIFIDAEGDGDRDLIVVSGGNEYYGNSEYMLPRLYLNDGQGNFVRDQESMPDIYLTGSVVASSDFDKDGDVDLFIGARAVPWKYGIPPDSYLLRNENGTFKVDHSIMGKQCADLGLVTDAKWADINADGYDDLVVASEWSSIKVIDSQNNEIRKVSGATGLWNEIIVNDYNRDGRIDIVAGNLGLNSKFKASDKKPLRMYVNDFDHNGSIEQIVTYIDNEGRERLFATKDELGEQLNNIHKHFKTYASFAKASLSEVIDQELLSNAVTYSVNQLESSIFYNQGKEGFEQKPLPLEAQFSPVHGLLNFDFTKDGYNDLLTVGNNFDANIQRGRYDASYGTVLANGKKDSFTTIPNKKLKWFLEGQIRQVKIITIKGEETILIAGNNQPLRVYQLNNVVSPQFYGNKK